VLRRLGRALARLRGHGGKGVPETAFSGAQRETVTTVVVPWRSSTSWDEYDLRVYPHRNSDRFQFYAEMGNPISVRVEASLPGPGLRVRVFCEAGREMLVQTSSDEHGVVDLFVVGRVGGMHLVEVGLDPPKSERPQSYRLSIDVARSRQPADETRRRRAEFVDVPVGHPYREAIAAVASADVMTGYGEWWEFAPDDPVSRVQLAELVRDSLGSEGSGAVPVLLAGLAAQDRLKGVLQVVPRDRDGSALNAAATSAGSPVVPPSARRPVTAIARAQAVSLIVGALERYRPGVLARPPRGFSCTMASGVHRFHARIAEYNGLLEGLVGFGPEWEPRLAVSRGEVAEMLWATMRVAGTTAAALGVYTSEYLLGAQEEIDRLMAESGPADRSPPRTEPPAPLRPLAVDHEEVRQNVEQTRDRLRAKTVDSAEQAQADTPGQETGASTDR
jgi:hypothetical protein